MIPVLLGLAVPAAGQGTFDERLNALVARLPQPGEALTFHIVSEPEILGVLWWHADGTLRFPDPTGMPHPNDQPMLALEARMRDMRQAPRQTLRDTLDPSQLYHCTDSPPVCLVLNANLLETAYGAEALGGEPRGLSLPLVAAGILAILGAGILLVLRHRKRWPADPEAFVLGSVTINPRRSSARVGSDEVPLTARDIKILRHLATYAGEVQSKDTLYDIGWGRAYMPNSRALDQHILSLRKKLGDAALIETVHGQGYRVNL